MSDFRFQPLFELGKDDTPYRKLPDSVSSVRAGGREILVVQPDTLRRLTFEAIRDISHLFRPGHLQQLRAIIDDQEASPNDRFVALEKIGRAHV